LAQTATERQGPASLPPIIQAALGGKVNLEQYGAFLTQALIDTFPGSTVRARCSGCGAATGSPGTGCAKPRSITFEDEIGHDEWILDDIVAAAAIAMQ